MKRDIFFAGALWLLLTAAGEFLVLSVNIHPLAKSDKGDEIRRAFDILMVLAVPVFTMVVSVLVYTLLRRSAGGASEPPGDGETMYGRGPVPAGWLAITAGLTVLVMIYPGLTSLKDVVSNELNPDVVIDVKGAQWTWLISYPQSGITNKTELVLPVNRTVRFSIESLDVIHSFWIPRFMMKIDAVPGKTTGYSLKTTEIGSFETDSMMRVQCAELCGLSHGRMTIPVRVVSEDDFKAWVTSAQTTPTPAPTAAPTSQIVQIAARNTQFDKSDITVQAGKQVTVKFSNQDAIPHNWSLYQSAQAATSGKPIVGSQIKPGPADMDVVFDAPAPGTYYFRCDVHPQQMNGTFTVK